MADQQDRPEDGPEPAAQAPELPAAEPPAPAPPEQAPAKRPAAKKAPAKKAPAKKAPAKKVAAKKAPAKKAAAKQAPPPKATPTVAAALASTNGAANPEGAKEAAAQAKSTIDQAGDAVPGSAPLPAESVGRSPVPFIVAFAMSLLAVLLVRRLRHQHDEG